MKSKFEWYLHANPAGAEEIWKTGLLTVDANVLLDLYRYHSTTCESILAALEAFEDRVWISYQAASEFFANRKRVIASSEKTFREAGAAVDDLSKALESAVSKLRGYRLVPRPVLEQLSKSSITAIEQAHEQLGEAAAKYPNYLREDPILDRLLRLFDGRIGDDFEVAERAKLMHAAEQRIKAKQPPGYMDEGKEGDHKYGDYILWSQIMSHAKSQSVPLILVTSEQKEDWWEKPAGRTLGPRMELIKEFHQETGQQIFVYQTDHFLELSAKRAGKAVKEDVVAEIREVRAQQVRQQQPAVDVEQLPQVATAQENYGTLEIELMREVGMMTGSGHLAPAMAGVPEVRATVTKAPLGCPAVDVRARTGTTFDFNVHVRPVERGRMLPVGMYVIEYECIAEDDGDRIDDGAAQSQ